MAQCALEMDNDAFMAYISNQHHGWVICCNRCEIPIFALVANRLWIPNIAGEIVRLIDGVPLEALWYRNNWLLHYAAEACYTAAAHDNMAALLAVPQIKKCVDVEAGSGKTALYIIIDGEYADNHIADRKPAIMALIKNNADLYYESSVDGVLMPIDLLREKDAALANELDPPKPCEEP